MRTFLVFLLVLLLSGCATPLARRAQTQELQNRINLLERELMARNEQIRSLERELSRKEREVRRTREARVTPSPTPKRIQRALRNAGFYRGPIDGKIGPKSREAIKAFQRANGLTPDGIVGRRTWPKLSKYLN